VLLNRGPQSVQWQASLSVPAGQAGIEVSPPNGELASGASTAIHLQLHQHGHASGNQQGSIQFAPTPTVGEAGQARSLSYTTGGSCD
jgi:hypothetical protein